MHRLNAAVRNLSVVLVFLFLMAGCQSTSVVRMYDGPDLPSDQLAALVVPWCIELRTVDATSAPLTLRDELKIMLKPGAHTLEARYVVTYPTVGSNSEKITSDYVRLTFMAEPGKTYTIGSKDPKSLEETRRYAAHVSLWIEGLPADGMEAPAAPPNGAGAKAELAATTPRVETPAVLAQLLEAWEKASEQERKAFLDKVLQQHR